jgi:hypothetical protein
MHVHLWRDSDVALGAIDGGRNVTLRIRSGRVLVSVAIAAMSLAAFLLVGRPTLAIAQQMAVPGKVSVDPNGNASYSIPTLGAARHSGFGPDAIVSIQQPEWQRPARDGLDPGWIGRCRPLSDDVGAGRCDGPRQLPSQ